MHPDYLFIDLENVIPGRIAGLLENQVVLIFTGARQNKINRELVVSTQPFGRQIQWIIIDGMGKNAADFHIAYYLGVYAEKDKNASFTILSKDTGFDPLIKHCNSKGTRCRRTADINDFTKLKAIGPVTLPVKPMQPPPRAMPVKAGAPKVLPQRAVPVKTALARPVPAHKRGLGEIIADVQERFKLDKKRRPKSATKFIAYVKSLENCDENLAKTVMDKMLTAKLIEIKNQKLCYLIDPVSGPLSL
jgi:hypothetical protein